MDNRAIGFFDSGLGGLTSIPPLFKALPRERVIYFGDTARTPYGSKAVSTIRQYACQIADFLVSKNVKDASYRLQHHQHHLPRGAQGARFPALPIVGIVSPAAEKVAASCDETNRIGVIGTKVTIASGAYRDMIRTLAPQLTVFDRATPAFVPLIEEGIIENEIMDLTIHYYMDDFVAQNRLDTLVLGCTHYPLIRKNIERLYPGLEIIDPSQEIIGRIRQALAEKRPAGGRKPGGRKRLLRQRPVGELHAHDPAHSGDGTLRSDFKIQKSRFIERTERKEMDKDRLYELLDIEEPEDFQYFENIAALLEADEEIDYDALYALLSAGGPRCAGPADTRLF